MKKEKLTLCISIILLLGSCEGKQKNEVSILLKDSGKWTFINVLDSTKYYGEIDFIEDKYSINSLKDGYTKGWFMHYKISKDFIFFNNSTNGLKIKKHSETFISLKDSTSHFVLYKIPFNESNTSIELTDLFYLRKCYFMVNLGYLTIEEASLYLSRIVKPYNNIEVEEEIINLK